MKMLNSRGAVTAPWGTPAFMGFGEEVNRNEPRRSDLLSRT